MPWPTPADYQEAVQNPRLNLRDAELQAATPVLDPLGLPRPISGGFASVYQMRNGKHTWAVRCFLKDIPDQRQRYERIYAHLQQRQLDYFIDFAFLSEGVRVRGQWYPVLEMAWVPGVGLDEYLTRRLGNRRRLEPLAEDWLAL